MNCLRRILNTVLLSFALSSRVVSAQQDTGGKVGDKCREESFWHEAIPCQEGLLCGRFANYTTRCCEALVDEPSTSENLCARVSEVGEPCNRRDEECKQEDNAAVVCHRRICILQDNLLQSGDVCDFEQFDLCANHHCGYSGTADSITAATTTSQCCDTSSTWFQTRKLPDIFPETSLSHIKLCSELENGEPCLINEVCNSEYCSDEAACADDPTLGGACEQNDDCKTSSCALDGADPTTRRKICCQSRKTAHWNCDKYCLDQALPAGQSCFHKTQCTTDLCILGVCAESKAEAGEPCGIYPDCINGLSCGFDSFNGTSPVEGGAPMCCEGSDPRSYYCSAIFEDGMLCPDDSTCISGVCLFGVCASEALDSGALCDSDNDCKGTACAPVIGDENAGRVCCASGEQAYEPGYTGTFCTATVPTGEVCDADAFCISGVCLSDGICAEEGLPIGDTCEDKFDCLNLACGRESVSEGEFQRICCPSNMTRAVLLSGGLLSAPRSDQYCNGTISLGEYCEYSVECESANCLLNSCSNSGKSGEPERYCFSGNMVVMVKGKGAVRMEDVVMGDMVQSNWNEFSRVYAFAHADEVATKVSLLQIHFNEATKPLEITADHLVFVQDEIYPIPASNIKVGTRVRLGTRQKYAIVTRVQRVDRTGVYGPLTTSGTIVVNNVLASNFIALKDGTSTLWIGSVNTGLSMHWVGQAAVAPLRSLYAVLPGWVFHSWMSFLLELWLIVEKQHAIVAWMIVLPTLAAFGLVLLLLDPRLLLALILIVSSVAKKSTPGKKPI